jgi:hypothetical protein
VEGSGKTYFKVLCQFLSGRNEEIHESLRDGIRTRALWYMKKNPNHSIATFREKPKWKQAFLNSVLFPVNLFDTRFGSQTTIRTVPTNARTHTHILATFAHILQSASQDVKVEIGY